MKITLNGNEIGSREELYRAVGEQTELPEWFGKNLDALHDVLTEKPEKLRVTVRNPEMLAEGIGERYLQALFTMLLDSGAELTLTRESE